MRKLLIASLCLLSLAPAALADLPAWTKEVAGDAKFVVRIDVKILAESALGQRMLDMMDANQREGLQKFTQAFGFDPTKDLDSVVIYGDEYKPGAGVAIFHGKFDQKKLLELLAANAGHEEIKAGDRTIHRWTQKAEDAADTGVRFGAFAGEGTVVIARSQAWVGTGLTVIDGKKASLAAAKDAPLADLSPVPDGTFVQAVAADFHLPDSAPANAAWLQNVTGGMLVMGESKETAFVSLSLAADKAENAQKMRQVLQGFAALGQLALMQAEQNKQPAPPWAPLVTGLTIGGEGLAVTAKLSIGVKELLDLAQKAKAAKAAGKALPPQGKVAPGK